MILETVKVSHLPFLSVIRPLLLCWSWKVLERSWEYSSKKEPQYFWCKENQHSGFWLISILFHPSYNEILNKAEVKFLNSEFWIYEDLRVKAFCGPSIRNGYFSPTPQTEYCLRHPGNFADNHVHCSYWFTDRPTFNKCNEFWTPALHSNLTLGSISIFSLLHLSYPFTFCFL